LFEIPGDPPNELCDASKLFWSRLKDEIRAIGRTLDGIDDMFTGHA
jgi:hypothetical protein